MIRLRRCLLGKDETAAIKAIRFNPLWLNLYPEHYQGYQPHSSDEIANIKFRQIPLMPITF